MGKRFITLAIGIALVFCAKGQGFEAKFIAGAAISQIDGDKYGGYNQLGAITGFATNFYMADKLSFQQEIVYYGRGSRKKNIVPASDNFTILGMHYVDLNGVLNFYLDDDISICGGAGYGVLIQPYTDAYLKRTHFRPDIFVLGGVGYKLKDNITLMGRWQYSVRTMHRTIFPFHNNTLNATFQIEFGGPE